MKVLITLLVLLNFSTRYALANQGKHQLVQPNPSSLSNQSSQASRCQNIFAETGLAPRTQEDFIANFFEGEGNRFQMSDPVRDHNPYLAAIAKTYIGKLEKKISESEYKYSRRHILQSKSLERLRDEVKKRTRADNFTYEYFLYFTDIIPFWVMLSGTKVKYSKMLSIKDPVHIFRAYDAAERFIADYIDGKSLKDIFHYNRAAIRERLRWYYNGMVSIPTFLKFSFYDFLTFSHRILPEALSLEPIVSYDSFKDRDAISYKEHDYRHSKMYAWEVMYDPNRPSYDRPEVVSFLELDAGNMKWLVLHKDYILERIDYISNFFRDYRSQLSPNDQVYVGAYFFEVIHEMGLTLRYLQFFLSKREDAYRDQDIQAVYERFTRNYDFGDLPENLTLQDFTLLTKNLLEQVKKDFGRYMGERPPPFEPDLDAVVRLHISQ